MAPPGSFGNDRQGALSQGMRCVSNAGHIALQCINEYLPTLRANELSSDNPFTTLFEDLDSDYLIALNIGAVWNVISLWVHQGMKDDPGHIKDTVREYINRIRYNQLQ